MRAVDVSATMGYEERGATTHPARSCWSEDGRDGPPLQARERRVAGDHTACEIRRVSACSGLQEERRRRRTERDVELEREADDGAVGVEQPDGLARGVDLRVRHQERAVHLYGALLSENAAELVVHELGVGVVVDFCLRVSPRSASLSRN